MTNLNQRHLNKLPKIFQSNDGKIQQNILKDIFEIRPNGPRDARILLTNLCKTSLNTITTEDSYRRLSIELSDIAFREAWYKRCISKKSELKKIPPFFILVDSWIQSRKPELNLHSPALADFFEKRKGGLLYPLLDRIEILSNLLIKTADQSVPDAAFFAWSLIEHAQWLSIEKPEEKSLTEFRQCLFNSLKILGANELLDQLQDGSFYSEEQSLNIHTALAKKHYSSFAISKRSAEIDSNSDASTLSISGLIGKFSENTVSDGKCEINWTDSIENIETSLKKIKANPSLSGIHELQKHCALLDQAYSKSVHALEHRLECFICDLEQFLVDIRPNDLTLETAILIDTILGEVKTRFVSDASALTCLDDIDRLYVRLVDAKEKFNFSLSHILKNKENLVSSRNQLKQNLLAIEACAILAEKKSLQAERKRLKQIESAHESAIEDAEDSIATLISFCCHGWNQEQDKLCEPISIPKSNSELVAMEIRSSGLGSESFALTSSETDYKNIELLDTIAFKEISDLAIESINLKLHETFEDDNSLVNSVSEVVVRMDAEEQEKIQQPNENIDDLVTLSISNDENVFSSRAGEICRPIWKALKDGRYSIAYHYSSALEKIEGAPCGPSSNLLAIIALANKMVSPDGSIAYELDKQFAMLDENYFKVDGAPASFQSAINLLLVAATIRPIFIEEIGSAAASLRFIGTFNKSHETVYRLAQTLIEFSDLKSRFQINVPLLRVARSTVSWNLQLESVVAEIKQWQQQERDAILVHAAASKVWSQWQKADGEISKLFDPIIRGNYKLVDEVKLRIESLNNPVSVIQKIRLTDKKIDTKLSASIPEARAFSQILARTRDAIMLARKWLSIVELQDDAKEKIKKISELFEKISNLNCELSQEFLIPPGDDNWEIISIARTVLLECIKNALKMFDSNEDSSNFEVDANQVLGEELLLAPPLLLDSNWESLALPADIISGIESAEKNIFDFKDAFDKRIEMFDLEGATLMCESQNKHIANEEKNIYQRKIDSTRAKCIEILGKKISEIRSNNEIALANGLINEIKRSEVDAKLVVYEMLSKDSLSFGIIIEDLDGIARTIKLIQDKKMDDLRKRLDSIKSHLASETIEILENTIASGDILTANEQFQRAENGERLMSSSEYSQNVFSEFFPEQLNAIDNAMKGIQPAQLLSQVQLKSSIGPLDYSSHEECSLEEIATVGEMLEAWFKLKTHKGQQQRECIRSLLLGIGFEIDQPTAVPSKVGARPQWDVRTKVIADRAICQVPNFGSNAKGQYRITVIEQASEDSIIRSFAEGPIVKQNIVFFLGRLNERKRKEISRQVREAQRSFILVDEIILFKLAATVRGRLPLFFDLTLPFSYSVPFDPTSSIVPIEMFFGRAEELQSILGLAGRCFIYGGRQLGKTALLRKAEQDFHSPTYEHYAKWIDLKGEGIGISAGVDGIWDCLFREFREIGLPLNKTNIKQDFSIRGRLDSSIDELRLLFKNRPNLRVLLLLDEADKFFELDAKNEFAITSKLKAIMESTDRRFKVVFAGLHNVLRASKLSNNPLAHLGEPIQIGPLIDGSEWHQAENLITKPFSAAGFKFKDRNLVTRILAQTNYYPNLIQLYCSHLLRYMTGVINSDQKLDGPEYQIQGRHIDAAYKNKNRKLLDEIRAKFQLTLQLDTRYEVIAYSIAYDMLNAGSLHESAHYKNVRELATGWWPEGFVDTDEHEFKVLLDEMVGLGVLRETSSALFTLRNPNVILLLGGCDEIESLLSMKRELPPELEHTTFRKRLSKNESRRRSCLTAQDVDRIKQSKNSVSIVIGCEGSGMSDLESSLFENMDRDLFKVFKNLEGKQEFNRELQNLLEKRALGTMIVLVPISSNWTVDWIDEAIDRLGKLKAKDRFAHILFVADAHSLWHYVSASLEPWNNSAEILTLKHWTDGFTSHWLEDCTQQHSKEVVDMASSATGLWPTVLYRLLDFNASTIQERISNLNNFLSDQKNCTDTLTQFGFASDIVLKCMTTLAELGPMSQEMDVVELSELDEKSVRAAILWGQYMGYVTRSGETMLTLNSWLAKLLCLKFNQIK